MSIVGAWETSFIDLNRLHAGFRGELVGAFERVLDSGRFTSGREVAAFEESLAQRVQARHAVGVASGTAAIQLVLVAAGVGAGDEVIVPANTFFATAGAVFAAGATPVFADVRPETALIDPSSVEALVTPRTAAIVAVHLYGRPADMDSLVAIAARHKLFLLEDAAQAMGAEWDGRAVGSLGDAAAFSFYPTKNLGGLGEGGAVTADDPAVAARVARLRNHGESVKNVHVELGLNERLDELQAALLSVKLRHLDESLSSRDRLVDRYRAGLAGIVGVGLFATTERARPAHHLMVVSVEGRDAVLERLREMGVPAAVHYPTPVHLQPACRFLGLREGSVPNAERLATSVLSLPLYAGMAEEQVDHVVDCLADAVGQPGRPFGAHHPLRVRSVR